MNGVHGVEHRIAAVLAARRRQIPVVEQQIACWEGILRAFAGLESAVDEVRTESGEPLVDLDVAALRADVTSVLGALARARARVGRSTVNIGVSGRARNGKSTLLQSLSGLSDQQIPAGRGGAVTAVRSRILHSPARSEAQLTMHTERSFCEDVLAPYFAVLELPNAPRTLDEFAACRLPADGDVTEDTLRGHPRFGPMLARLREMRESLATYRGHLTGGTRRIEMDELRGWVAYPPEAGAGGPAPDRRYLAVRDALISCPFPIEDVVALGLVDLPGLGELVPRAEEHHVAGLEDEVDFVVLVKRPTDTNTLWSPEDAHAQQFIADAGGPVAIRDFMTIVVNTGGCAEVNIAALNADLDKRLNEGTPGRFHRVINVDNADREAVRDQVLAVTLDHLAAALPRMDAAVLSQALDACATVRERLSAAVDRGLGTLRSIITPTATEELIKRAEELRLEIAESLQDWVEQLRTRAAGDYEDAEFQARSEQIVQSAREWIMDGFGEGRQAWADRALGRIRLNRSAASFVEHELNAIRVDLARRFSVIDDVLLRRRERFWADLVEALGPRLGRLLDTDDPREALRGLAERLHESPEPSPALAESLAAVLDVRLDYRTRVLPSVRRALEVLYPRAFGDSTEMAALLEVPPTAEGAGELFAMMSELAREAAHESAKVLADDPGSSAQVLQAYGEQFEDSFIRSDASEAEFRRVTEAFGDQLWPEHSTGSATAPVQHLRSVLTGLRNALRAASTGGVLV